MPDGNLKNLARRPTPYNGTGAGTSAAGARAAGAPR
jgi:hypothetical protein